MELTESIVDCGVMPAFVCAPSDGADALPVVVLMHERYGLVEHTRDLARRCARDGYLVLAPNFFHRHPDQGRLNAGQSRYDLSDDEAVDLLGLALQAAGYEPRADMARIAIAGYCQTGRHPLVFAARAKIAAAIVWYGAASKREWGANALQPSPLDEVIAALDCPVFGCFGDADHIIAVEDVLRLRDALEAKRKSYDIHVLAGAPHGWLNDTMPGRYRRPQADAGWAAQQAFLARVLAPGHAPDGCDWRFTAGLRADYDFANNVRLE